MYPQDITPEESEIGFVLRQIENPTERVQKNPWIKSEKKISAVVLHLENGERVVKMQNPMDKNIHYSYQRQEGEKWMPVASLILLEQVKALLPNN